MGWVCLQRIWADFNVESYDWQGDVPKLYFCWVGNGVGVDYVIIKDG